MSVQTKSRVHTKIKNKRKKEHSVLIGHMIQIGENTQMIRTRMTVEQAGTLLSSYCSKSSFYDSFRNYVCAKNRVSLSLLKFDGDEKLRKLNWYSQINRRRSEDKFINAQTFGNPDENLHVMMGNYGRNTTLKGQQAVPGKSMRRFFTRHHYNVYLVDEF